MSPLSSRSSAKSVFLFLFWTHQLVVGVPSAFIGLDILISGKATGVINAIGLLLAWIGGTLVWGFAVLMSQSIDEVQQDQQFEAQGLYKGTPYRARTGGQIEAMSPGGRVTFRGMEDFIAAIDGGTIELKRADTGIERSGNAEFPNKLNDYLYCVEKDGSVSAVNGLGKRSVFRDWESFRKAAHPTA